MPTPRHIRIPVLGKAAPPIGSDFVSLEAASGIVLLLGAAAALVWVNADTTGYTSFWHHALTIGPGDLAITESLVHWVNDALMTIFFFAVGLEIKRELVTGELRERNRAALPAIAALGGMAIPALIFVAINLGGGGLDGWAIPMATDIAFAVGVLALLGPRVPAALKIFLLALAIIDDLGAIIIIALFYTEQLSVVSLALALAGIVLLCVLNLRGVSRLAPYALTGLFIWVCVLKSGVHATLAGVVVALAIPLTSKGDGEPPLLEQLEENLHPWVAFAVLPLFAFANAGVSLQ